MKQYLPISLKQGLILKIFLLEDDFSLNSSIKEMLEDENHTVFSFYDGAKAIDNISNDFSLFILDINVPNINGLQILKYIKSINKNANILIISANIGIDSIKEAYELGCEDYIKKPFDIEELLLKVAKIEQKERFVISNNALKFDIVNKRAFFNDIEIPLTKNESYFLYLLFTNIGHRVTYSQIEEFVYSEEKSYMAIRSMIKRLRQKLPKDTILNSKEEGYFIV